MIRSVVGRSDRSVTVGASDARMQQGVVYGSVAVADGSVAVSLAVNAASPYQHLWSTTTAAIVVVSSSVVVLCHLTVIVLPKDISSKT